MSTKAIRIRLDIEPCLIDYNKISSNKFWYHLKYKKCPTISLLLSDISKRYMWKQTSHLRVSLQHYQLPKDETTEIIEEDEILTISYFKYLKRKITQNDVVFTESKLINVEQSEKVEDSLTQADSIIDKNDDAVVETKKLNGENEFDMPIKRKRNRKSRAKNKSSPFSANNVPMKEYSNSSIIFTNYTAPTLIPNVKPPKSKRRFKDILPQPSHITFQSDEEVSTEAKTTNIDQELLNETSVNCSSLSLYHAETETSQDDVNMSRLSESNLATEHKNNGDSKVITPVILDDLVIYKRQRNKKQIKSLNVREFNTSTPQNCSTEKSGLTVESLVARGKEMKKPPDVNDWIVYKILELGSSYTPEISDFRFGKVIDYDQVTQQLDIKLVHIKSDDAYELGTLDTVCWTSMIEPRVVEGFDLANLK